MHKDFLLDSSIQDVKNTYMLLVHLYPNESCSKALTRSGVKYSKPCNGGPCCNPNNTGTVSIPFGVLRLKPVWAVLMAFSAHWENWGWTDANCSRANSCRTFPPNPSLQTNVVEKEEKRKDVSQQCLFSQKTSREIKAVTRVTPNLPVITCLKAKQGNSWQNSL